MLGNSQEGPKSDQGIIQSDEDTMKYDIILAGVGGQGVLSLSATIAFGAMTQKLHVKQSEVHGMAQRGGSVVANLRLSDKVIGSDLIPLGSASMILSMEPIESLRYLPYLSPEGHLVTSVNPVINIPDYPKEEEFMGALRSIKNATAIDAEKLAREAGAVQATNMVMVGAASRYLPVDPEILIKAIKSQFGSKGEKIVETNLKAFQFGREASHK